MRNKPKGEQLKENTENEPENTVVYGISNAFIQVSAILASNYFGISWPMYIIMAMIVFLGGMHTIAAAGLMSKITETEKMKSSPVESHQILIGFIYLISAYQLYLMGFEVFSGFTIAHALLIILTQVFKGIKQ